MPFAAALSFHPVPAYATGEVIGELTELLATAPDLLVVIARPGHAGALEDIAATIRKLLDPRVLIGGVSAAVGSARTWADTGPGLGVWAATGATVRAWRADSLSPQDSAPPHPTHPSTAMAIVLSVGEHAVAPAPAAASAGGVLSGPLVIDGAVLERGCVGALIDQGVDWSVFPVAEVGPLGPTLTVTALAGRAVVELDGSPALDQLTAIVRDHVPASDLGQAGSRLYLGGIGTTELARVLGSDPANGAIALGDGWLPMEGDRVVVHAGGQAEPNLISALCGRGDAEAGLVFAAPEHGRIISSIGSSLLDPGGDLPGALLVCETRRPLCAPWVGARSIGPTTSVALFSNNATGDARTVPPIG